MIPWILAGCGGGAPQGLAGDWLANVVLDDAVVEGCDGVQALRGEWFEVVTLLVDSEGRVLWLWEFVEDLEGGWQDGALVLETRIRQEWSPDDYEELALDLVAEQVDADRLDFVLDAYVEEGDRFAGVATCTQRYQGQAVRLVEP